jgi:hypothetical protein
MLLKRDAAPVAMVLGTTGKDRIRCSIGYKRFWLPPLQCLSVTYCGLLGQMTGETSAALLGEMGRLLRSSEADVVSFVYVDTRSPLFKAVAAGTSWWCRSHFNRLSPHRTMAVPTCLETFYQSCSRKHRAVLRRHMRKIEERFPGRAVVTRYTQEDSVDSFLDIAARISARTYQHTLGCGVSSDDRTRRSLHRAARKGWLRAHVLSLAGAPCAFQYGMVYRGKYLLEQMGFDPRWKDLSVGTVLFLNILEDLCCDENNVRVIDFGFGDADYKERYGQTCWTDVSFHLFAPRVRPLLANLIYSSTTGLSGGLTCFLERTGSLRWIKRYWRDLLQGHAGAGSEETGARAPCGAPDTGTHMPTGHTVGS